MTRRLGTFRARFARLYGTFWLPLYLLVGVSWLLAPAVAHQHYGVLRLISVEESLHGVAGTVYRLDDILAAVLLLLAAWSFQVGKRSRLFGKAVVAVAVLSAIDGLFPDTCYIGHAVCGVVATSVSAVHDVETIILATLVALLSVVDAARHRRLASLGFVSLQLVVALFFLLGFASQQFSIILQYVYETALIVWMGWLIDRYNPVRRPLRHQRAVRGAVAAWVAAGGIFSIVTAIPRVGFARDFEVWGQSHVGIVLEQHGIVVGVVLLYVARHILRGERPALWLALALFYTQIIKYSLLTPQVVGVVVYGALLALLVYARRGFDRNIEAPSWASRLRDVGVVVGGALAALVLAVSVVAVTGNQRRFNHEVRHIYDYHHTVHLPGHRDLSEHTEARLRILVDTFGISLVAVVFWSLFRPKPASVAHGRSLADQQAMADLLHRYGTSSEDYFKLWPSGKSYFFRARGEGALAYRVEGGIAFVLADPVAPNEAGKRQTFSDFLAYARRHGWTACVLCIGGSGPALYEDAGLNVLQIGSSAVIDVAAFNAHTKQSKWWRWQRNRAARSGWRYERLEPPHSAALLRRLRVVSDAWLSIPGRTEQGFALGYFDETYLGQCVIHVLCDAQGTIMAFANELPRLGSTEQASVDLIRHVPSADGAMPVLLLEIISRLEDTPLRTFDLGFVPFAKVENELARLLRRVSTSRFSSRGLEQFKNKFDPDWHPDYLAYDGDILDLARIAGSLERVMRVEQPARRGVR
jgi:phosphatidylglycerol lysyltransferase